MEEVLKINEGDTAQDESDVSSVRGKRANTRERTASVSIKLGVFFSKISLYFYSLSVFLFVGGGLNQCLVFI